MSDPSADVMGAQKAADTKRQSKHRREALAEARSSARAIERQRQIDSRAAESAQAAVVRAAKAGGIGKNGLAQMMKALNQPGIKSARPYHGGVSTKGAQRPKAPDSGGVTFHYSITSISKSTGLLATALTGGRRSGTAASHEAYIERDGAAEKLDEGQELTPEEAAVLNQIYIERPGAAEDLPIGMKVASFGNISESYQERMEFWQKLEAIEQDPGKHTVRLRRDRDDEFWERTIAFADQGNHVPAALLNVIKTRQPTTAKLNDQEAIDLVAFMRLMQLDPNESKPDDEKAIHISQARGGRVQTRIIAELPHELSPLRRLAIATDYCKQFDKLGLPYWAVIHAPDEHNDSRNFHIHIALSERPSKRIIHPETGQKIWDFEYEVIERDRHRNIRTKRPFLQNRDRDVHHKEWPKKERHRWCDVLNKGLEKARVAKRYDARSYKAMGVNAPARNRITPEVFAKERKGEITKAGLELAKKQWHDFTLQVGYRHEKIANLENQEMKKADIIIERLWDLRSPRANVATAAVRRAHVMVKELQDLRLAFDGDRVATRKMISRVRLIPPKLRLPYQRSLIAAATYITNQEFPKHEAAIAAKENAIRAEFRIVNAAMQHARKELVLAGFRESVQRYTEIQHILIDQEDEQDLPPPVITPAYVRDTLPRGETILQAATTTPAPEQAQPTVVQILAAPDEILGTPEIRAAATTPAAAPLTASPAAARPAARASTPAAPTGAQGPRIRTLTSEERAESDARSAEVRRRILAAPRYSLLNPAPPARDSVIAAATAPAAPDASKPVSTPTAQAAACPVGPTQASASTTRPTILDVPRTDPRTAAAAPVPADGVSKTPAPAATSPSQATRAGTSASPVQSEAMPPAARLASTQAPAGPPATMIAKQDQPVVTGRSAMPRSNVPAPERPAMTIPSATRGPAITLKRTLAPAARAPSGKTGDTTPKPNMVSKTKEQDATDRAGQAATRPERQRIETESVELTSSRSTPATASPTGVPVRATDVLKSEDGKELVQGSGEEADATEPKRRRKKKAEIEAKAELEAIEAKKRRNAEMVRRRVLAASRRGGNER